MKELTPQFVLKTVNDFADGKTLLLAYFFLSIWLQFKI